MFAGPRAEPPRVKTDALSLSKVPRSPLRLRVSLARQATAAAEQARTSTQLRSHQYFAGERENDRPATERPGGRAGRSFVHCAELRKTPSSNRQLPEWRLAPAGRPASEPLPQTERPTTHSVHLHAHGSLTLSLSHQEGEKRKSGWRLTAAVGVLAAQWWGKCKTHT